MIYKTLTLIIALTSNFITTNAQNYKYVQPYGEISSADLVLKSCDFETDANAMILFDEATVTADNRIIMDRHKRIKIFNRHGIDEANIRLPFIKEQGIPAITDVKAQTINFVNGNIEITPVDPKTIYLEKIDRYNSAYVFTFPKVKEGSVIEYAYKWQTESVTNFPIWLFQDKLPIRYSQLETNIVKKLKYSIMVRYTQPFEIDSALSETGHLFAFKNIHTLPIEPFMGSIADNIQCVIHQFKSYSNARFNPMDVMDSWYKIGKVISEVEDFSDVDQTLKNESVIMKYANDTKSITDKIAYLFNYVKTTVKWDGENSWYTNDGIVKAWQKKEGNSADVNLILYHLLLKSGVETYPLVLSTPERGKLIPDYPNFWQLNKVVVYIPIDSTRYYILDATDKHNFYNELPLDVLNRHGLIIDKDKIHRLIFLQNTTPAKKIIYVNAEIKADGSAVGFAQINNFGYNKIISLLLKDALDEKTYKDILKDNDENIQITSVTLDNAGVDSLPLMQKIDFKLKTITDENYIYLNPNLFTQLRTNPFKNVKRYTDIDFGCLNSYAIRGVYKIPAGYKIDALPEKVNLVSPDERMVFKRITGQMDGSLIINYSIDLKQAIFKRENYQVLHDFFLKMHELLNEPIVFKKI
jgi:hypothetical protein